MSSNYTANNAAAYERLMGRWSRFLAREFIAFAGLGKGDRILDLCCGTGSLAATLAARDEPSEILGIDISEAFIVLAQAQSRDPRLSFRTGNAVALDLPDGRFDRCYSMLAVNFIPESPKALAEMRRVTRPGGTVAVAVWDFAGGLTYQRLLWDTAAPLDPAAAAARARQYAAFLTWPGELEAALAEAGVRDVTAASLTMRMTYANFADYWQPIVGATGPVGDYIRRLAPAALATLASAVESAYLSGRPDGPRSMTATAWAAKGQA